MTIHKERRVRYTVQYLNSNRVWIYLVFEKNARYKNDIWSADPLQAKAWANRRDAENAVKRHPECVIGVFGGLGV